MIEYLIKMDPLNPLFALGALLICVITAYFLVKKFDAPPADGRYLSIDGLRGYLAFFVFLHHSSIWYFYLKTGLWRAPPSNLYNQFGKSSVALFFMITAFLFYSKLIDGRSKPIHWNKLFVSRFLRLTPLYLFAMLLLFSIVFYLTNSVGNEPVSILLRNGVKWIGFTILGAPNLNGLEQTQVIVAGVTWSLPYEVFFYLLLPILALTTGAKSTPAYMVIGVVSLFAFTVWRPDIQYLFAFLGGIVAAYFVRLKFAMHLSRLPISSFIIIGCMGISVVFYKAPNSGIPIFLTSVAFALIAAGNTIFGVLTSSVSRMLGQMAYSIYMLHGIVLFLTFKFATNIDVAKELNPMQHWLVIFLITPVLIIFCFTTFNLIEYPCMQWVPKIFNKKKHQNKIVHLS